MTDYEREYQRGEAICGDPFPEFVALLEALPAPSSVLDLGAGQGRDALVAARLGHRVVAVDRSPTGIRQILEAATRENLSIEGFVADLAEYDPDGTFDVVVLDRVVHMLKNVADRKALLAKAARATAENGYALVADIPTNLEHIEQQFGDRRFWQRISRKSGRIIYQRISCAG